jgi:hypothetical protein
LGIPASETENIVELYLKTILIYPVSSNNILKLDGPQKIIISRRETILELERKIARLLMNRANDKGERSMVVSKMRLWRYNIAFKAEEVKKIED